MGTTSDKLVYLNQTKQDIKTAIEAKGVTVGNVPFRDYAVKVGDISGSSANVNIVSPTEGEEVAVPFDVDFKFGNADNFKIKVDGIESSVINLKSVIESLSEGSHTIEVEAFDGTTFLDSQVKNVNVASTFTYEQETTDFMNTTSTPDDSSASIYSGLTNHDCWVLLDDVIKYWKTEGVWTEIYHWHPMFGGTAAKHSYNAKDVNAFQMTWFGSWVHNELGNVANASNTYSKFGFIPNDHFGGQDVGMTIVSTSTTGNGMELGSRSGSNNRTYMAISHNDYVWHFIGAYSGNVANSLKNGIFTTKKVGTTVSTLRNKATTPLFTSEDTTTALSTVESYYGAYNELGTPSLFSGKTLADAIQHKGSVSTNIIQEGLRMWNEGLGRLTI